MLLVVAGDRGTHVLGVLQNIDDELPHVVVLESVEDAGAIPAGRHEPGETQFRQMLGNTGRWLIDCLGKVVHRELSVDKCQEQPEARAIGQHLEHLCRKIHLILGGATELARLLIIRVHT